MKSIEERKKILSDALNQSFVDDYKAYRNIVDNINHDFKELDIDYEWNYDDFCVDFLNESLNKLEYIDIFYTRNFKNFYKTFWNFNLVVLRSIVINKFEELGYDHQEYIDKIEKKNFLDPSIN